MYCNFLGFTVDGHFSWTPHIQKISNKISRTIRIMCRLKRFPTHILKLMYISFFCRLQKLQKRAIRTKANSKYNAHTDPLFRRINLLKVKDIFMLNILKMYYKYPEKSLTSYTANMFSVATCASNYNLGVAKSLTNVNTKTISDDKCFRSDLLKVINDKIATHSYQAFAFYFKRVTIGKYNQHCHIQNCF